MSSETELRSQMGRVAFLMTRIGNYCLTGGMRHIFQPFLVILTIIILVFICYSAFYMSVVDRSLLSSIIHVTWAGYLTINVALNYLLCMFTKPGSPPESASIFPQCTKCSMPKPPRTHHCSVCNKCCLLYDHHCAWLSCCIGLNNHGYFIRFLVNAALGAVSVIILAFSAHAFSKGQVPPPVRSGALLAIPFTLSLIFLSIVHIYLVLTNQTTVELTALFTPGRTAVKGAYNKGWKENLKQGFGGLEWWRFLLPTFLKLSVDGLHFPPTLPELEEGHSIHLQMMPFREKVD
eukprot:gnl/Dysnectes_brevis/3089_a3839_861.p1 GENE.gnl/Dysnectes_brevis/3089_a3839_861~~gnl/Dysnectes_brevis/3089_a3839_861.p1  ORF type:complete len:291 (-),score=5.05 gnl/Dysnectes_brevis/3089_a3839_861:67-939(-)